MCIKYVLYIVIIHFHLKTIHTICGTKQINFSFSVTF